MAEEQKVVRKKIAAAADVGKFMAEYYLELDAASKKGEPKIAWCTSDTRLERQFSREGERPE